MFFVTLAALRLTRQRLHRWLALLHDVKVNLANLIAIQFVFCIFAFVFFRSPDGLVTEFGNLAATVLE